MASIGGNITGCFQTCTTAKNEIGESEKKWEDAVKHIGWLDLQSGESKYSSFHAKLEESTHIFLCDYKAELYALAKSDVRAIFKGFVYDVLLIDNPMELNEQLEIYLRKVGAWNG
jgi:hypothetical protein